MNFWSENIQELDKRLGRGINRIFHIFHVSLCCVYLTFLWKRFRTIILKRVYWFANFYILFHLWIYGFIDRFLYYFIYLLIYLLISYNNLLNYSFKLITISDRSVHPRSLWLWLALWFRRRLVRHCTVRQRHIRLDQIQPSHAFRGDGAGFGTLWILVHLHWSLGYE